MLRVKPEHRALAKILERERTKLDTRFAFEYPPGFSLLAGRDERGGWLRTQTQQGRPGVRGQPEFDLGMRA